MIVRVWFLRQRGFWPALARLALFSPWDEVAIEHRNVFYVTTKIDGVVSLNRAEYPRRSSSVVRIQYPDKMTDFLNRQIKRPFDWCCYMPFMRKVHWSRDTWWFSSELVACALRYAGCSIDTQARQCTPTQLWRQLPKIVID